MKKKIAERDGVSLLEVLVAGAILAVASFMLFMTIRTMTGISMETDRRKSAAAALSASIAYGVTGGGQKNAAITETAEHAQFEIGGIVVRGVFRTYTTEDGQSFSVFEAQ